MTSNILALFTLLNVVGITWSSRMLARYDDCRGLMGFTLGVSIVGLLDNIVEILRIHA